MPTKHCGDNFIHKLHDTKHRLTSLGIRVE